MKRVSRTVHVLAILASFALIWGCGGSGGDGPTPLPVVPTAAFTASTTGPAANLVRLASNSASSDMLTLDVVINGPTSNELYNISFALELGDTSVVQYVDGSVSLGTVLVGAGCDDVVALADQDVSQPEILSVTFSKVGTCLGNGVASTSESVIGSLSFRVLRTGSSTIGFVDPSAALDPSATPIPAVTFDSATATITGS